MNNKIPLLLCLLSIIILGTNYEYSYGNANELPKFHKKPPSYEVFFTDIGYKSVETALDDFEQHFNQELKLPLRVPPISFTHNFGRFNNLDGEINDAFEVKFINDQLPGNHFKIDVRPIEYKIDISEQFITKNFKLNNGSIATYIENFVNGFNLLIFERNDWQYMFSISKKVADEVTPDILVQIANSIDY